MRENSSFASMAGFVNTAVSIVGVLGWWKHGIKLRLLDVGLMTVDSFQSSIAVD